MSYTADGNVRAGFVKARRFHIAGAAALFGGVLTLLLAMHGGGTHGGGHHGAGFRVGWPLVVGAVLSFAGLSLMGLFWRCPSCKRNLEDKFNPPECPRCGVSFK